MKLEHLYRFLNYLYNFKLFFDFNFLFLTFNFLILNYFFSWKISNFGDSYWFLYSNKKSIHELRYLNK